MTNFASIIFIIGIHYCFVCTPFLLHANTVNFNTILIEGNSRISDGAIKNYSQLRVSEPTSAQDLSNAYSRMIGTGLFKNVEFKETDDQLTIFVEDIPISSDDCTLFPYASIYLPSDVLFIKIHISTVIIIGIITK